MFGPYKVRIDPWEVDYGAQTPLEAEDPQPDEKVTLDVELPEADWRGVTPPSDQSRPDRVVFVDGVRRLEVRLLIRQAEHLVFGAFGSLAVGAVAVGGPSTEAGIHGILIRRLAVLGSGEQLPGPVRVRECLVYQNVSTASDEIDGPLRHVQKSMRTAEASLAQDLCRDDTLVVIDGPLSFESHSGVALGYIKRIHRLYVPQDKIPLLAQLPRGARTPVFVIHPGHSGFPRYSWFQRLAAPPLGTTDFHGLVRLEVSSSIGKDAAIDLANAATSLLPTLAPTRSRDPRSPQNLLPIGALEARLKAYLGHSVLVRRWIETLVAREASHV